MGFLVTKLIQAMECKISSKNAEQLEVCAY